MNASELNYKNNGFTLIELMISLTLIGIILVIVFGAFRIGVRAWEHGDADMIDHQRQRIILQRLKQQLASAIVNKIEVDEGEDAFFFKGGPALLEFISDASLMPGNDFGRVFVKYVVESDPDDRSTLTVYENNLFVLPSPLADIRPESEAFRVLLSDVGHLSFKFLKIDSDQQFGWVNEWDAGKDQGVPDAVQISIRMNEKLPIVSTLARIVQEAKE